MLIKEPIYGYGKTYNDYGQGFYCTENIDMAKEWAVSLENEQRQKNINKAQAEYLVILARVLYCEVEDLIEKVL